MKFHRNSHPIGTKGQVEVVIKITLIGEYVFKDTCAFKSTLKTIKNGILSRGF